MIDSARIGGSSPSFLHGLSLIGQYFNQQRARQVTIAEVDTGFLLHYFPDGDWRKPRALAVQHTDLLELSGPFKGGGSGGRKGLLIRGGDNRERRHPLFPMGYDVFFRFLGYKLDRRKAAGLTICEAHDKLYVNYWLNKATFVIRDQRRQAVSSVQVETFDATAIQALIVNTQEGLAAEALRYDQGMKMNHHDHISTLAMAFMLENDGNYRDAEALLARIVSRVPEHPEAHYHLARLLISRGDRRGALDAARRAIAIRDDLAPLHDLYGRILQQLNKHKDAVPAFEQAVSIDPEHGIYHFHLARAYEAVGRKEEAAAEMALAATEHAAPAWDMVQEEMSVEAPAVAARLADLASQMQDESPAARAMLPTLHDSPAAAALLPPLPKEEAPAAAMEAPVFQADWGASVARAERQATQATQAQAGTMAPPSLTTFEQAVPGGSTSWPQAAPMPPETAAMPAAQAAPPASAPVWPPQPAPDWAQPPASASGPAGAAPALTPFPAVTPSVPPTPAWPDAQATAAPGWSGPMPAQPPPAAATDPAAGTDQVPMLEQRLRAADPATASPQMGADMPAASGQPGREPGAATGGDDSPPQALEAAATAAAIPSAPQEPPGQSGTETSGGANAVEIAAEILMIRRALEAEPNRADLHRKLGFLLARQGKTAEAATEFRKALQCSRTNL